MARRRRCEGGAAGGGDPGRALTFGTNSTQYFLNYNSNKRSIVIDIATPGGRELLLKLAPNYDVFVENYAPGVIEKLDIGYEAYGSGIRRSSTVASKGSG